MFLTCSGRLFHNTGVAYENDLSPYDLVIVWGTQNKDFLLERRILSGLYCVNNSTRYDGPNWWKHWYANKSTLKWIRDWIGNQCKFLKTEELESCFFVRVTSGAAEFWMSCKRWICWDGRPKSKLLQKSKWHITKAWIRRLVVVLSKKSRILPILYNPNDAERHFCDTKFSKVNLSSKVTPKCLHIFAGWTRVPSKFSVDIGLVNLWQEEPWINSVLILLSFRSFIWDHSLTDRTQLEISVVTSTTSFLLNAMYNCVSSA